MSTSVNKANSVVYCNSFNNQPKAGFAKTGAKALGSIGKNFALIGTEKGFGYSKNLWFAGTLVCGLISLGFGLKLINSAFDPNRNDFGQSAAEFVGSSTLTTLCMAGTVACQKIEKFAHQKLWDAKKS